MIILFDDIFFRIVIDDGVAKDNEADMKRDVSRNIDVYTTV